MNYDRRVLDAKAAATRAACVLVRNDQNGKPVCDGEAAHQMAAALDGLNTAWDELTACLVRQREERDEQISRLMSELAEAKHKA